MSACLRLPSAALIFTNIQLAATFPELPTEQF
jgi:hypothetical protein